MSLPTRALWIALLVLATGCGQRADTRVIQGHWVAEKFRVQGIGVPIGPDLNVSQDQLGFGGGMEPLKLRGIKADGVEVTLQTEIGLDIVFAFEDNDRMYFTVPFMGDRIYYRRNGAAQTSVAEASAGSAGAKEPGQPPGAPASAVVKSNAPIVPKEAVAQMVPSRVAASSAPAGPVSQAAAMSEPNGQIQPSSEVQYRQALDAMQRGDADASLRYLSAALAGGFADWQRIDSEPLFTGMTGDVRFQVLRSRWKKG